MLYYSYFHVGGIMTVAHDEHEMLPHPDYLTSFRVLRLPYL